jgi:hypothetical protein
MPGKRITPAKSKKPKTKPEMLDPFAGTFEQAIDKALGKKKPAGRSRCIWSRC